MKKFLKFALLFLAFIAAFALGHVLNQCQKTKFILSDETIGNVVIEKQDNKEIFSVVHEATKMKISVIEGDKIIRMEEDGVSVSATGHVLHVVANKLDQPIGHTLSLYYSKNSYDPRVSDVQFSPNGKYVSFSVDIMGYQSSYLFDLESYRNLIRKDEYIFDSPVEWGPDSQTANFKSKFTGEGGEGYDGNVKFDAKTDNFFKI